MDRKMKCSVCGQRTAEEIFSSAIAPVSYPYCKSCMEKGAEPYNIVVTRISLLKNPDVWPEHLQNVIQSTVAITGHTLEQLKEDVKAAIRKRQATILLDKIKGGLFGVAIGDALGGTTEFMTEEEIKQTYDRVTDMIGGGVWKLIPGEVTDDTQMTMCVARGIIANPADPVNSIGTEFLNWFGTKPKDVGNIISEVLYRYNGDWFQTAENVHMQLDEMSAGNGSLMRCLPVALAYESLDDVISKTRQQSKMTHFDDEAADACVIYNRIASRLLKNEPLKQVIEEEVVNTIYEKSIRIAPDAPPDGYVVHTFLWVIYYLYHIEDFTDVAIFAANKGGDSDTIAAIACGLKGVEIGFNNLPENYKEKILLQNELSLLANELFDVRVGKKYKL